MECVGCGRPVVARRTWPWARQWCSARCRREMVRELRELSMTVARCGAAIEMPQVVASRDDLIRRFVSSVDAPAAHRSPAQPSFPPIGDLDGLPTYWE